MRNSGVHAVVEGVGDHGCEYMTGGRVVVLGSTGRNFAAGMSGGIAYVYDEEGVFADHCNQSMCEIGPVDDADDEAELKTLIERHVEYTNSDIGRQILASWDSALQRFVKVLPTDYKRVQEALARARESGLSGDEAVMAAFEANKADASRAGGN